MRAFFDEAWQAFVEEGMVEDLGNGQMRFTEKGRAMIAAVIKEEGGMTATAQQKIRRQGNEAFARWQAKRRQRN